MEYVLSRLPLILLFVNGCLLYSLFSATGLTGLFAARAARFSRGNVGTLLFTVMASAALLSFFISNTITVLAFLPLLKTLDRAFATAHGPELSITTPLTLSVIYGANIGGMGSLIGSPANLLLIAALDYFQVPGREHITFLNWFAWSLPLVALFLGAAWLTASLSVPRGARRMAFPLPENADRAMTSAQRAGLRLFLLFLAYWCCEAVLSELSPGFKAASGMVSGGFFLAFLLLAFWRTPGLGAPVLRFRDLFSGLPGRGLAFLVVVGLLIVAVRKLELDRFAAEAMAGVLGPDQPPVLVFFLLVLSVIFLTEIFSNTVVSATFFSLAFFTARARGLDPLPLMMAVSLASTCAFMTPVATPCNALAYGEMRGASLIAMLRYGAVLNVAGAVLLTLWLRFVIPLVYE